MSVDGPLRIYRSRPAPGYVPTFPLVRERRGGRHLSIVTRTLYFETLHGWVRVPAGYITDFASIPRVVAWRIEPFDTHCWAAIVHDWWYAVGQADRKSMGDDMFRERMEIDGVWQPRRTVMYRAVKAAGGGGYANASKWWPTENFGLLLPDADDPDGAGFARVSPPFFRDEAFIGGRYGLRPQPDWVEPA